VSEVTYTFCDRCCPGMTTLGDKIRRRDGRGWAEWPQAHCIVELGWEERPEGVVCPECLDEEVER